MDRPQGGRRYGSMRKLALAALLIATPALAVEGDLRSVAGMKTHNRVLIVFAPALTDPRLEQQRKVMAHFSLGAAERDLLLVQVAQGKVIGAHDSEEKLRDRFHTPAPRYRTLLLGKDGSVALDAVGPVDEQLLKQKIDAMPMRQAEVAHARAGRPLPRTN